MPSSRATCATTGAAAHAGGDEQHVAALDELDDAVTVLHGRLAADLRVGAGTESLGDVAADLQRRLDLGMFQRLRIGVDAHELHPIDAGRDHVRHGVAAAAAHADHLDDGALAVRVHQFKHVVAPYANTNGWLNRSSRSVSFKSFPGTRNAYGRAPTWRFPGSPRGARARRCHGRRAAAPRRWNKSDCAPRRTAPARSAARRAAPARGTLPRPARSRPPSWRYRRSARFPRRSLP